MFVPLPPEQCQMDGPTRAAFPEFAINRSSALDPILFQHRDTILLRDWNCRYRSDSSLPLNRRQYSNRPRMKLSRMEAEFKALGRPSRRARRHHPSHLAQACPNVD